jgi:hypothetical protein
MSNGIPASNVQPRLEVTPVVSLTAAGPMSFLRATWDRWKKIAHAVGVVQTRLLLVVFYFIVVFPLGLVIRLTDDRLHLKPRQGGNWTPARDEEQNLSTARRQF